LAGGTALTKEAACRSRIVIDPRSVLREFGTELPDDVEVRVWDSSAEVRSLPRKSGELVFHDDWETEH
jgi:Nitrile hydratase, alpha chain